MRVVNGTKWMKQCPLTSQMVYLGAYSRFLSYVAGWSVLVGELSTLSITASYRASAVMDLLGLVDPSSGWKARHITQAHG